MALPHQCAARRNPYPGALLDCGASRTYGKTSASAGLPFKRGARNAPIEYLEKSEIEGLLGSIDRTTCLGSAITPCSR